MHPDEPREGEDTNQNGAQGEDERKRKTHDGSMRNRRLVPLLELNFVVGRRSSGVTGGGRSGGASARSGTAGGGLRHERVQGVSTFGLGQIEVDLALVVMLLETGQRLRVAFDGGTAFDGPYPFGITRGKIHGSAVPPTAAIRACSCLHVSECRPDWGGRRRS